MPRGKGHRHCGSSGGHQPLRELVLIDDRPDFMPIGAIRPSVHRGGYSKPSCEGLGRGEFLRPEPRAPAVYEGRPVRPLCNSPVSSSKGDSNLARWVRTCFRLDRSSPISRLVAPRPTSTQNIGGRTSFAWGFLDERRGILQGL